MLVDSCGHFAIFRFADLRLLLLPCSHSHQHCCGVSFVIFVSNRADSMNWQFCAVAAAALLATCAFASTGKPFKLGEFPLEYPGAPVPKPVFKFQVSFLTRSLCCFVMAVWAFDVFGCFVGVPCVLCCGFWFLV